MLVRTQKSQNPHTSLISVNSIAAVENSGAGPQKVKHIIPRDQQLQSEVYTQER